MKPKVSAIIQKQIQKEEIKENNLYTKNCKDKKDALNNVKRLIKDKFTVYEIENKFIHDRFAILDNELFHFGGTVDGKTTEGFSAFSCGWNANKIQKLLQCKDNYKWIM